MLTACRLCRDVRAVGTKACLPGSALRITTSNFIGMLICLRDPCHQHQIPSAIHRGLPEQFNLDSVTNNNVVHRLLTGRKACRCVPRPPMLVTLVLDFPQQQHLFPSAMAIHSAPPCNRLRSCLTSPVRAVVSLGRSTLGTVRTGFAVIGASRKYVMPRMRALAFLPAEPDSGSSPSANAHFFRKFRSIAGSLMLPFRCHDCA